MRSYRLPKNDSMSSKPRSDVEKLKLVREWSDWFYNHSTTYRGSLGLQLAYLWPAMLFDRQIEVSPRSSIVKLLKREGVDTSETIWEFLDVVAP